MLTNKMGNSFRHHHHPATHGLFEHGFFHMATQKDPITHFNNTKDDTKFENG